MPLWPFRRKSGRKRPRSGAALSDAEGPPPRSQTDGAITRADSKKKQRTEPGKLQRRPRTYSFSPGRNDDLGATRRTTSPSRAGPSTQRAAQPMADSSWGRTPTLHHKGSERRPMRRKSSRKKKEERQRAAEIKAMSTFDPVRPAADPFSSGRPMKKESRRSKTTSGFRGQPTSDVSLPIPESMHSSLSSDSDHAAFKVSAFDSLAPRPTLRYAPGTRGPPARAPGIGSHHKRPLAEREPIAEETLKNHRRVDDLADDLDARDLRELMEREDRRREKKRQREQDRASRRLARKAEKQAAEGVEARQSGTPPPKNLERGVAGRELVGLGIDPESVTVTTSVPEPQTSVGSQPDVKEDNEVQPALAEPQEQPLSQRPAPPNEELRSSENIGVPTSTEPSQFLEPGSSTPQTSRLAGILRSKKSRSKSTLASEREKAVSSQPEVISEEGDQRRPSWTSEKRGRFSLTSFVRWGGKSRRSSGGPSSFSNTSREEMQASAASQTPAQAQAQALAKLQGEELSTTPDASGGYYMSRKPSAGAALRAKSRFKEDLPDFPMSPPDSRMQSPEGDSPYVQSLGKGPASQPIDIPGSGQSHTQSHSPLSPSPEPHMSMSMASIDSEASWLSGRVGGRRSAMREHMARIGQTEYNPASDSPTNSTREDLAIAEDDYLARLARHRHSGTLQPPRRSEDGRPSSDEEEDFSRSSGARWGAVGGARPQVVHAHKHDRSTMQSQEGLLNIESGDDNETDSPVTPSPHEGANLQRARSVNLGRGHVRNFSAGSAKLLDITPRTSVDSKARSASQRRSSGPLI